MRIGESKVKDDLNIDPWEQSSDLDGTGQLAGIQGTADSKIVGEIKL
jgi:hypothetical protein